MTGRADQFVHLGSIDSSKGGPELNVTSRNSSARFFFALLPKIWKGYFRINIKFRLFRPKDLAMPHNIIHYSKATDACAALEARDRK